MTKYRIRMPNGRVIGPFDKLQLFELKAKGHIRGNEEAQVYPTGDWGPLSSIDVYAELMDTSRNDITIQNDDNTFVIDLEQVRQKNIENELDQLELDHAPMDKLTETIRMSPSQRGNETETEADAPELLMVDESKKLIMFGNTSSAAIKKEPVRNLDKTIINPVAQEEILAIRKRRAAEEKKRQENESKTDKDRIKALVQEDEIEKTRVGVAINSTDETQFIKLDQTEDLLELADEEDRKIKKKIHDANAEEDFEEDEEEEEETRSNNKTKRLFIIGAAIALACVFLFPDEDSVKNTAYKNLPAQIAFPIPFDKADPKLSKADFNVGKELFDRGDHVSMVKAGLRFKRSYENNLENTEALCYMVRVYAEELLTTKTKLDDATTLFKIIQSKRPILLQNPNGVIGLNMFYMAIDKSAAANDIVSKYLKLHPDRLIEDLFAVYLKSLIVEGKLDKAKQFYLPLAKNATKNRYTYDAILDYLILNQEQPAALEVVNEAIKKYPQLVKFYLRKAEILFVMNRPDEVAKTLVAPDKLNMEYNDYYLAKYLSSMGLYLGIKGKIKAATNLLNKSLFLVDNPDLRTKLSDLNSVSPSIEADKLIRESRAYKLLSDAKELYEKKKFDLALSTALKATDIIPLFRPTELFVAKIQLRIGLISQSLKTLEDLVAKYPQDKEVQLAYLENLINAYKFNDAKTRITLLSATRVRESFEYASLNAKLYFAMGDNDKAYAWLRESVNSNPLNDADLYRMGLFFIKRGYFDKAREFLNKAMELDPVNVDYRIAYARMIYETQDDKAAVGYLLNLQDDFGEDPKILGEIATIFYRVGKEKDFQAYKKKLEDLPVKDKALYEFLIQAAILDERYNDVPKYVEELIKVEPGDLESMMTAGKVMFEMAQLEDAAKWFKRVQDKMSSYPKVLYFSARIKYLSNDFDGALQEIEKDIKLNGENDVSLSFLGKILVGKGEYIKAENLFKKAQKINANSYDAVFGLAELSKAKNNYEQSLDLYNRALKLRPDEATIHQRIGDVYRLLGQGALAIESYKMYLEMKPDAPDKTQIENFINLMQ